MSSFFKKLSLVMVALILAFLITSVYGEGQMWDCPECGRMTEISWHPEDVITLPDGSKGVEAWCPNCDTDFFAKET